MIRHRRCFRLIVALIGLGAIFSTSVTALATEDLIEPSDREPIAAGVVRYTFRTPDESGVDLIFIDSDESGFAVRIIGGTGEVDDTAYSFPTTLSTLQFAHIPVVVSGAYSQRIGGTVLPLGYLKVGGQVINRQFHNTWVGDGLFCVKFNEGQSALVPNPSQQESPSKRNLSQFQDCFQTGPRLFENGENVVERPEDLSKQHGKQRYMDLPVMHLVACKDASSPKNISFGITTSQITLNNLLRILPRLVVGTRKLCYTATELSGNTSAGLLVKGALVAGTDSFLQASAVILLPVHTKPKTAATVGLSARHKEHR